MHLCVLIAILVPKFSTVVLNCCKSDRPSQWETPIFGPLYLENHLTDFDEICYQWLRHRPHYTRKVRISGLKWERAPIGWNIHIWCLFFLSICLSIYLSFYIFYVLTHINAFLREIMRMRLLVDQTKEDISDCKLLRLLRSWCIIMSIVLTIATIKYL